MGILNIFKKEKENIDPLTIYAPIKGKVIGIETLADKTFAGKIMGDGLAIIPKEGKIYSPVDGVISALLDTYHAYGITADAGFELLIHIGQDTVNLKGNGFVSKVKQDQKVKKGDLLGTFDLEEIRNRGYNLATPVIVMNGSFKVKDKTIDLDINPGDVLFTVSK